jgi:hypothetical protein
LKENNNSIQIVSKNNIFSEFEVRAAAWQSLQALGD